MNFSGADRTRQLVTVGIGTLLLLVMGGVLIAGFRLATQMNAKVMSRYAMLVEHGADWLAVINALFAADSAAEVERRARAFVSLFPSS